MDRVAGAQAYLWVFLTAGRFAPHAYGAPQPDGRQPFVNSRSLVGNAQASLAFPPRFL